MLTIIVLHFVIKTDNKYYPQTFLEECVYKQQKHQKQQKNYITEELESDSVSNNESESDSDSNDETKSDIDNDE